MKTKTSGRNYQKLIEYNNKRTQPLKELMIENSSYPRHRLKERILKEKLLEYKCQCCGLGDKWNEKKLVLQLDHINGVNNDHRLENLRFICPNCHTQQHTYAAKNRFNPNRQPKKYV